MKTWILNLVKTIVIEIITSEDIINLIINALKSKDDAKSKK